MTTPPEDRRRQTYARLASHRDPLLREIGDQLGSGVLRPSDLLTDPSYRNVLARSLRRVLAATANLEAAHGHGQHPRAAPARPDAGATPPTAEGTPATAGATPPTAGAAAPPWEDGGPIWPHPSDHLPDQGHRSRRAGPSDWSER